MIEGSGRDRIETGGARTTIGGDLAAKYCIHAVGPAYSNELNWPEEDALLRSAYTEACKQAAEAECKTLGFALLSAGIFRGGRSLETVLRIGAEAIREAAVPPLEDVYLVGYTAEEVEALESAVAKAAGESGAKRPRSPSPGSFPAKEATVAEHGETEDSHGHGHSEHGEKNESHGHGHSEHGHDESCCGGHDGGDKEAHHSEHGEKKEGHGHGH